MEISRSLLFVANAIEALVSLILACEIAGDRLPETTLCKVA